MTTSPVPRVMTCWSCLLHVILMKREVDEVCSFFFPLANTTALSTNITYTCVKKLGIYFVFPAFFPPNFH